MRPLHEKSLSNHNKFASSAMKSSNNKLLLRITGFCHMAWKNLSQISVADALICPHPPLNELFRRFVQLSLTDSLPDHESR